MMSGLEIRTAGGVDEWRLLRWASAEGDALTLEPPSADEPARLPPSPFGVAYPVRLRGVGRVYLWADGFTTRTSSLVIERELAQRYLKATSTLIKQYARRGAPLEAVSNQLQQAQAYATKQQWLDALAESVQAAEQGAVSVARTRLQRMRGRTAFLWGVRTETADAARIALHALAAPLNLLQLTLDSSSNAWHAVIQQVQSARIAIAASVPDKTSPPALTEELRTLMSRHRGQVRYWTLAALGGNDAGSGNSFSQLAALCEAARTIDFGVVRLLRGVHSFYQRQSAYPALEQCVEMGVPFEAVHLEWRWYDGTLYDLDQLLERYGELGKPIHLELALPPSEGYAVFTRDEPLLWLEGACLIALSKPYVVALRFPLIGSEASAGLLADNNQPNSFWEQVRALAVWNRTLQECA